MKINVKKQSINDLADMSVDDFNRLTADELRVVNRRLTEQARKRVKWVEQQGQLSLMETYWKRIKKRRETDGVVKRGKKLTLNELRGRYKEIKTMYQFDRTREATREHTNRVLKALQKKQGVEVSLKNVRAFFETIEKLEEEFPEVGKFQTDTKYNHMELVASVYRNSKIIDKEAYLRTLFERFYKKQRNNDTGTSRNPLNITNEQYRRR